MVEKELSSIDLKDEIEYHANKKNRHFKDK